MDAPHFIQVGDVPVFSGAGNGDLRCPCGHATLIHGYLPGNYLAIRIQCFRCGALTTTPGLPEGEILPRAAVGIAASATPVLATARVSRGDVIACQDGAARDYPLTRPHDFPPDPLLVSRDMLEAAAADYDRLTGGRLAEQMATSPSGEGADQGPYPFAWAVERLRPRIDTPGWSWLMQDDDAMATMYVTAMHHLMACWGHHALLTRLAAPLALPDRFLRTTSGFAMAKLLHDAGNRVGFSLTGGDVDLHFTTAADEPLSFTLLAPEALQWRAKDRRSPDTLRAAVSDAMASAQGRVNRFKPGIVVLASSILQPDFDQMVVDAIHAAFQSVGRRYRGVAALAIVMPKVVQVGAPDRLGFGYAFYPIRNPRFVGENPIRLGPDRTN